MRVLEHELFELLEAVRELLHNRIITIDHCIHERIREVPWAPRADRAEPSGDAFANRIEESKIAFLEREHILLTHDETDLRRAYPPASILPVPSMIMAKE